jgi:Transposase DDE domain group 1
VVSLLAPGNQTSSACLRPTVAAVAQVLGLTPAQRRRTVLRLDGGFGPDANLNWALWHGYHVLAKGYSGKRANAFARAVARWEEWRAGERWVAPAPTRLRDDRRTQTAVLKWKTEQGTYGHRLLTTSLLAHTWAALAEAYDDRAAIEAEMKADKGGLQHHRRRKRRLAAQEALVLLTDLAHNLLAWTRSWIFRDSPFADAGIYRMVNELLPIPGKVLVKDGQIVKLRLKASHPLARPMLACLTRLLKQF